MKTLEEVRQAARQAIAAENLSYSIELYEHFFENSEDDPLIEDVINYGAILRKTKQLDKASLHYIYQLPKFEKNIHLIQNACNCWIELKEFERCRTTLEQALSTNRNNTTLLLTLGYTELSAGQYKKACQIFENILQIDSEHFDAWFNIAVAKAKVGGLEEALSCFRKAKQLKSNHQLLNANIVNVLKDLNKIQEAWAVIKGFTPTVRSSQEVRAAEATLLMAEEKYTEASHLLHNLIERNPQNAKYWLNWINCLKALKFTVAPARILKIALL